MPTNNLYLAEIDQAYTGERIVASDNVHLERIAEAVEGGIPGEGASDWDSLLGKPTTLAGFGITDAASDAELAAHEADTTGVHGITNTALLLTATQLNNSTLPAAVTTLAASGAVSGAGFTARFATPGPIGNGTPSTGAFTTLSVSGLGGADSGQILFGNGNGYIRRSNGVDIAGIDSVRVSGYAAIQLYSIEAGRSILTASAADITLGANAAIPVTPQVIRAANASAGTGAALTLKGGTGTSAVGAAIVLNGGISTTAGGGISLQTALTGTLVDRLTILTDGKIGIGTAGPGALLHVQGTGANSGVLIGQWTSADNYSMVTLNGNTGTGANFYSVTGGNLFINRPTGLAIYFRENSTDQMAIVTGGKVGIGTVSPSSKLSINGGLHVGGDSDAGDNNALIDGTLGVTGASTLTGGAIIGAGTAIAKVLSAAAAIDFASMLTATEDTKTITVTGASTTNTPSVTLGWSASLEAGITVQQAWVSAADTVSIRVRNNSVGTIDPASVTVRATVTSF